MGYLRLALSLIVMAGHTGAAPIIYAQGAVFLFYAISGYFGALAMGTTYKGKPLAFLASRYLRIWPCYLVVFLATSTALLFWHPIDSNLRQPGLLQWMGQLFLIYHPQHVSGNAWIVPPGWMLPIMLSWWAAIALGITRSRGTVMGWLGLSVAISINQPSYYSVLIASMPFALGAWAYEHGLKIPRDGRYGSMAGALSYPIYITHYGTGAAVAGLWGLPRGWPLFWVSLPIILLLSWGLWRWVEVPVTRYRKSLKE